MVQCQGKRVLGFLMEASTLHEARDVSFSVLLGETKQRGPVTSLGIETFRSLFPSFETWRGLVGGRAAPPFLSIVSMMGHNLHGQVIEKSPTKSIPMLLAFIFHTEVSQRMLFVLRVATRHMYSYFPPEIMSSSAPHNKSISFVRAWLNGKSSFPARH